MVLQVLRDPSKLFMRYRVSLKLIVDFGRICLGPEETTILFDGEIERPVYMVIDPADYFEAHIITSEWTEVITLGPRSYFINPGRLAVRLRGIRSTRMCWNVGRLWEIWVE
jgi:hypothetical protein